MGNNLIDNTGSNTLSAALDSLLPNCDRIDALVGYFYFSGFREIYEKIIDKKIRILVGMELDDKVIAQLSRMDDTQIDQALSGEVSSSRLVVKQRYYEQLAAIVNRTDRFDSNRDVAAFNKFLEKIDDGSLEIRKTARREHGKFYILSYKGDVATTENSGVVIMGSSNLTYSGLAGQGEHNYALTESHYYQQHSEKFERLWNDSEVIVIADKPRAEEFRRELEKRLWIYANPDPYHLYLRVLHEYFSLEKLESMKTPGSITNGQFSDLQYQVDAINMGIDRLNKFGGVIIADVVGLGKSIIASAIAHNLGLKTVVICPPHLKEQWDDYRVDFNFNAQVFSTGKIEDAYVRFGEAREDLLIIIDEAHKHRNEDTTAYQALHKLCAGNKVIALSATPFNNDPKDIYALIKLFDTPGQSTLRTVENLSVEFQMLIAEYKKLRSQIRKSNHTGGVEIEKVKQKGQKIANQLRQMIEPVVIRRSRLDLNEIKAYRDDLIAQGVSFATVRDPELLEYELNGLTQQYIDTLNLIYPGDGAKISRTFTGARYKSAAYIRAGSDFFEQLIDRESGESADDLRQRVLQGQSNIAKFMRTLLVRRFESSLAAFQSTLHKMLASAEQVLSHYEQRGVVPVLKKGYMPSTEELEDMSEYELDELFDKLRGKGLIEIPVSELDPNFLRDIKLDIAILRDLQKKWQDQDKKYDPKFDHFIKTVKNSLDSNPNRKIIVFSEFADTADYVHKKLQEHGFDRSFKFSSGDSTPENKLKIKHNFDAGLPEKNQANDIDVLIATDAISEGYNLHRAGTIINYDIPYNPTRVIQRVGRINRINKQVFKELYIYNFFPTPTGEDETKTKAISTLKMEIIHALMGEDTKILTNEEELHNYFAKKYRDEESLTENLSWDAEHRNIWKQFQHDEALVEKVMAIPLRSRIARKVNFPRQTLSFAKLGANYIFARGYTQGDVKKIAPEEALAVFKAGSEEKPVKTTADFDPIYQEIKQHLFKNNTVPTINSRSRKQEALKRLLLLGTSYPLASDYCADVSKLIRVYDALPEGVLKKIASMAVDEANLELAYGTLKALIPMDYIASLDKMANRQKEDEELVLISEEIVNG